MAQEGRGRVRRGRKGQYEGRGTGITNMKVMHNDVLVELHGYRFDEADNE